MIISHSISYKYEFPLFIYLFLEDNLLYYFVFSLNAFSLHSVFHHSNQQKPSSETTILKSSLYPGRVIGEVVKKYYQVKSNDENIYFLFICACIYLFTKQEEEEEQENDNICGEGKDNEEKEFAKQRQ